jgi:hypothetical protein
VAGDKKRKGLHNMHAARTLAVWLVAWPLLSDIFYLRRVHELAKDKQSLWISLATSADDASMTSYDISSTTKPNIQSLLNSETDE